MAITLSQAIPVKPTGLFDFRSDPGDIAPGVSRINLNVAVTESNNPRRAPGWIKLFSESAYGFNNQDLHDVLIEQQHYYPSYNYFGGTYCEDEYVTRNGCREAILHLTEDGAQSFVARALRATVACQVHSVLQRLAYGVV